MKTEQDYSTIILSWRDIVRTHQKHDVTLWSPILERRSLVEGSVSGVLGKVLAVTTI